MIDKETLLKAALTETEVDIPGRGPVRVRALTRAEVIRLQASTPEEAEAIALSAGLVAPALTLDEAHQLLGACPAADLQPVVDAIMGLSGMAEGAQKSGGAGPDAGGDRRVGAHRGEGPRDDPG